MDPAILRAIKSVGSACAMSTSFVKIVSFDPFKVSPENLFAFRFKAIGLTSAEQLAVFKTTLASLVPTQLGPDIQSMPIDPDTQIGLVANHVEALLLKFDAGGFN